jgi:hypothetical protein
VVKVDQQHVKCKLTNDLVANVWVKDIFDQDVPSNTTQYTDQMKEMYKEEMMFEARIKTIHENTFKVDLVSWPSLMASHLQYIQVNHLDKFFQIVEEDLINQKYQFQQN